MPKSYMGHKFIVCIVDEGTNHLTTVSIYHSRSEETVNALIENFILKYCILDYIILDQDIFKKLDIAIKTVVPNTHQSLQADHGIKLL